MAIIEELGLAVSIVINGTPVPEYNDPDPHVQHEFPGTKYMSKYIESKSDTEYAIKFEALGTQKWLPRSPDHLLGFCLNIDGEHQAEKVLPARKWRQNQGASRTLDSVTQVISASQALKRKIKFSAINSLDDANPGKVKEDLERAKHIGRIRLTVTRAIDLHRPHVPQSLGERKNVQDLSIAEKALKGRAVSHATTLSPGRMVKAHCGFTFKRMDNPKTPYAVFDFYYRSKDALRSEMIIARTPSPSPAPSLSGVEAIDDLSEEEIRRLARERLAEIQNGRSVKREAAGVKREFDQAFDGSPDRNRNVRPKREQQDVGPSVKCARALDVKPVVISLLSDSDDD